MTSFQSTTLIVVLVSLQAGYVVWKEIRVHGHSLLHLQQLVALFPLEKSILW